MKPTIAISMGDPGGIGPEIVLKSILRPSVWRSANLRIVGGAGILDATAGRLGLSVSINAESIKLADGRMVRLHEVKAPKGDLTPGRPSRTGGKIAGKAIKMSVNMAINKEVDGIVTAPVSKESLALAGYGMIGHTEMLARLTGTKSYAMMLVRRGLRIVFATGHLPVGKIAQHLGKAKILERIKLAYQYIDLYMGVSEPRLGVACLNPHCGEGGFLGKEEQDIIRPAVRSARRAGINVEGPLPADYLLSEAVSKTYDGIIVMYHDQGMIALRSHGFDEVVNITLGIPIVRTSPGHGTAFEIAGKGEASEASMVCAIRQCARIVERMRDAGRI